MRGVDHAQGIWPRVIKRRTGRWGRSPKPASGSGDWPRIGTRSGIRVRHATITTFDKGRLRGPSGGKTQIDAEIAVDDDARRDTLSVSRQLL